MNYREMKGYYVIVNFYQFVPINNIHRELSKSEWSGKFVCGSFIKDLSKNTSNKSPCKRFLQTN